MKIVCDNCATKYSIADEKVRGKVFKIRCKKCSHIIVVRGGADGSVEASRDAGPAADAGFPGEDQQTIAAGRGGTPAAGVAAASSDQVWHLVIDREQVGPLSPAEVRQKFSAGEIDAETYAWREGFGDWLRLGSIEDFRDLGGGAPARDEGATRRTDSADLFAGAGGGDESAPNDAPSGDLFGGAAAPAYSSAPAPAAAEADVFGGGGGLFGAPSAAPAPRASRTSSPGFAAAAPAAAEPAGGGLDVRPMTGQRNENSVLFSLNNLQALATGGGGAKSSSAPEPRPGFANSQTEGSGLIDIRAMAASTLAASPSTGSGPSARGEELPGLGAAPVFSPMAAPILMPAAPSGPPKWMWAILGVGVMAVLGIVVVGVLLLTRKPEAAAPPTVAANTPAAAAAGAPAAAGTQPAAAAAAAGTQPAAAGTQPAAAGNPSAPVAQAEEKKHGAKSSAPKEHGTKLAKAETAPKSESPKAAAAEAPAAPAPKKGGKRDALDDLLNDASPESKPAPKKAAAAREESSGGGEDSSLPDQLDKGQIVNGMQKIKSRVSSCFDQFKVPGMANVAVTIAGSGRVSSSNVTGQFAGTPTGDCVAKAVKGASFPKFKGSPQSIVYPFILR